MTHVQGALFNQFATYARFAVEDARILDDAGRTGACGNRTTFFLIKSGKNHANALVRPLQAAQTIEFTKIFLPQFFRTGEFCFLESVATPGATNSLPIGGVFGPGHALRVNTCIANSA